MKRSTLEVRTDARATGIVFEGKRAVGVRYARVRNGPAQEVRASREVILCSGTVNTARAVADIGGGGRRVVWGSWGYRWCMRRRGWGPTFGTIMRCGAWCGRRPG